MMRAMVQTSYGAPEDVMEWREMGIPAPGPGQIRVRVRAASINAADYRLIRADPFLVRLERGWLRPKKWPVLGFDVSGVVDAVGVGVERFEGGEEVWGDTFLDGIGGFAPFVCMREDAVAVKPEFASFEEAAALPMVGVTALQALRGRVRPGADVLIQGAGGGVGTLMVQMAHALGARVTAVCSARSAALASAQGADRVIDYALEDPTAGGAQYDAIFGVNGHRPLSAYRRSLRPGGTYVMVGGTTRQILEALFLGRLAFLGTSKTAKALTLDDTRRASDLEELRALWKQGKLRPVLDRVFAFEDLLEALSYVEGGHAGGKVVVRMAQ